MLHLNIEWNEIISPCLCSVAQLCLTLCDPMDCSPPGSSVHGISQARIIEWVAISFSRGFSPGIEPQSLVLIGIFFTAESPGNFLVSFGRFIPWYFILFDAVVNGIVSLISLSHVSLLVYGNATDFFVLILYPAALLNSLMNYSSSLFSQLVGNLLKQ